MVLPTVRIEGELCLGDSLVDCFAVIPELALVSCKMMFR